MSLKSLKIDKVEPAKPRSCNLRGSRPRPMANFRIIHLALNALPRGYKESARVLLGVLLSVHERVRLG